MTTPLPQMTVAELIAALERVEDKSRKVVGWLPGQYMPVASVINLNTDPVREVQLEMNVRSPSAFEQYLDDRAELGR